jgi:hypothetical protein
MPPMNDKTLTSKERAFLEAARREAGLKAPAPAGPAAPRAPSPRAPSSPLDQATVVGWDHPAAQAAQPKPADDKWARMAVLMENERREADERRRRMRRTGLAVAGFVLFIFLIAVLRWLVR